MKLVLLVLGLALAIMVIVAVVVLAVSIVWVMSVLALQWRDLFSFDRWTEVMATIRRNKLRTALTMVSVAWGIFVLVFLLGLGHGLDNGMRTAFARDAANLIRLTAAKTSVAHDGYDVGRKIVLDNRDFDRAAQVKLPSGAGVDRITGQYFIRGGQFGGGEMMTRRNGKANVFQISAVHPDALYMHSHTMAEGRFLNVVDLVQRRKAAVIGHAVQTFLFTDGERPIGQWVNIAGVPFQVVGVFADDSGPEQERQIYVPVSTAQLAFNGADRLHMLELTVGDASPDEAKAITDRIVAQLADHHQFSAADPMAVRVFNNVENFSRFSTIFAMISAFVTFIGVCTLAAGVIGVSNIMMIAVKERTKEIGVRKALGATPRSIIAMITQEAVFLTGLAGLLGLSAGVALLGVVAKVVQSDFIKNPSVDLRVGVGAALGLVVVGALAGFFPARAAARVNPVATLRDQ